MKVDYISDLHINHYVKFIENQHKWEKQTRKWMAELLIQATGDVLVLAGDFSEWNVQSLWVLKEAANHYKQVFFVTGNHDRYLISKKQIKKYETSKNRINDFIDKSIGINNVTPLQRKVVTYNGYTIAGDGLWYQLTRPEDYAFFHRLSNDSKFIFDKGSSAGIAEQLYRESLEWYETLDSVPVDLMVSHVPPMHPPFSPYERNACYDCPVPFLVAPKWVCGHQHLCGTFEKMGTTFYMNAYGYPTERNALHEGNTIRQFTL